MRVVDSISSILKTKGSEVWSVSPSAPVFEAIEKMAEKRVGALAVVSEGKLVGMISERDYARKVILQGRSSKETPVAEIMTSPAITVTPQHTVEECMKLMTEKRIRHLPVMDQGRLAGVISIGDLVKWTITAHEETIAHLENYITGRY